MSQYCHRLARISVGLTHNPSVVMPGLVPGTHVLLAAKKDVGGRDKPGHDALGDSTRSKHVLALLAVSALLFMADHASSQGVADFYRGKTVRLIVGFGPGGGYDSNARLLGRFIGQYLPGNPRIVVQNMPVASSLKAVQYLDNGAPPDGTVVTALTPAWSWNP